MSENYCFYVILHNTACVPLRVCILLLYAADDECVTATGQALLNFHIRNNGDSSIPKAMLIVSFEDKQAAGCRLFGCSEKETATRTHAAQTASVRTQQTTENAIPAQRL